MTGFIYQINVKPETPNERGIPKLPVDVVEVTLRGLAGDYNRYRTEKKKGNLNKALMLLPLETVLTLNDESWPIQPGHLGENFTTQGIPYDAFAVGKRYALGSVVIEITEPCTPCSNLRVLPYIGGDRIKWFIQTLLGRRGWYAEVLTEGTVKIGDSIEEKVG